MKSATTGSKLRVTHPMEDWQTRIGGRVRTKLLSFDGLYHTTGTGGRERNYDVFPALKHELQCPVGDDYTRDWIPASQFPSEVRIELLRNEFIPDPFVGFNEHKIQCIGEAEWLYKAFEANPPRLGEFLSLEFRVLDMICDVYFNGFRI
ncbi:hypothetical protein P691DRAFT_26182 [Macrolepiota fuliginosa MF-IS2]|uniref:Beta-mannosidase-like galactose-binding domain-containing protein n=1 Tax=Macrolepiota fuliginosa MF-IS2 TaxID=1400762 RepID=A0A9P5XCC7_9AGAR|nr:hypothetical protein P691DRAFT_26182 [Macrolepiota fuliginosa MF-IS2]